MTELTICDPTDPDAIVTRKLRSGTRPKRGALVYHVLGQRDVEWFIADGKWRCPTSVNGYRYEVRSGV